jgi:hypothetical protein
MQAVSAALEGMRMALGHLATQHCRCGSTTLIRPSMVTNPSDGIVDLLLDVQTIQCRGVTSTASGGRARIGEASGQRQRVSPPRRSIGQRLVGRWWLVSGPFRPASLRSDAVRTP